MEDIEKISDVLDRIAAALEEIGHQLEQRNEIEHDKQIDFEERNKIEKKRNDIEYDKLKLKIDGEYLIS